MILSSGVLRLELFNLPAILCIVLLVPFFVQIFSILSLVFVKYKNQKSKLYHLLESWVTYSSVMEAVIC